MSCLKDLKTFEDVVNIVFQYMYPSKKDPNKPKYTRLKHGSFNGKGKKPNDDMDQNTKHILLSL